jgi:surface polysaccharide O-acyltransferase-like enzyme
MRIKYIDFLKVIGSFAVIVIHSISETWKIVGPASEPFKFLTAIDSLCRFCVPIFVMCSGAVFLNRRDSFKKLALKYALRFYILFVVFNTLSMVLDGIFHHQMLSFKLVQDSLISSLLLKPVFQLWYLRMSIVLYLSTPILMFFCKKNRAVVDTLVLATLVLLLYILPAYANIPIPHDFRFLLYYYLGYYLHKYGRKELILAFLPIGVYSYFRVYRLTVQTSILLGRPTGYYMEYLHGFVILMSILVFLLAKTLYQKDIKGVDYLSGHGLYIYLLHGMVLGGLHKVGVIDIYNVTTILDILLCAFLTYSISLVLSNIIYQIKNKAQGLKERIFRKNGQII